MQLKRDPEARGRQGLSSSPSKRRLFQELAEMAAGCWKLSLRRDRGAAWSARGWAQRAWAAVWPCPMRGSRASTGCGIVPAAREAAGLRCGGPRAGGPRLRPLAPAVAGVEHLKALAWCHGRCASARSCAKLRANTDPAIAPYEPDSRAGRTTSRA
jgi:PTS system nitrogen regulatory IIA component